MPITSLKFRPGINKETTSYSNKGGWNDCDKILVIQKKLAVGKNMLLELF